MFPILDSSIVLPAATFLIVASVLLVMAALLTRRERFIESRIRTLSDAQPATSAQGPTARLRHRLAAATEAIHRGEGGRNRLASRCVEAGIYQPLAPALVLASAGLLALLGAGAAVSASLVVSRSIVQSLLGGTLAATLGGAAPFLWLERKRARRQLVLRRAIPDFLDLVVACLSGGLSVQAALRQVADELKLAHVELSAELRMALREIELGGTLDRALQQMASRTAMDELKTLRSFIQQTTKFGTTITDALIQMAEMLRMQREQRAEELAQKAAVKILFPTMLFIFPTVFVVLAGPAAIQIQKGLVTSTQQPRSAASK